MASSVVIRDLSKVLSERLGTNIDIDQMLIEKFGNNFYTEMANTQTQLRDLDNQLLTKESVLKSALKDTIFDSDSIIEGIKRFSFDENNEQTSQKNLVKQLFGDNFDINDTKYAQVMDAIYSYNSTYTSYFNTFTANASKLSEIGQTIRGDKMLYTVGIDTGNGKLKEYLLNSKEWEKFSSQRESFGLYRDEKGNITLSLHHSLTDKYDKEYGLNASKLVAGIEKAKGNEIGARQSLRQHTLGRDNDQGSIRQEIWNALSKTNIYSQSSIVKYWETGNQEDLVSIFNSRKYEILNSGIWEPVYNKDLTSEKRTEMINSIVNNQVSSGFILENIFGGARGDNMLIDAQGNKIATQQKFFGSAGNIYGFSAIGFIAMDNAFGFYSKKENIIKESEMAAERIANSTDGEKALEQEGRLLAYQEGAMMLADMGFIGYDEVDEIAQEAAAESEDE